MSEFLRGYDVWKTSEPDYTKYERPEPEEENMGDLAREYAERVVNAYTRGETNVVDANWAIEAIASAFRDDATRVNMPDLPKDVEIDRAIQALADAVSNALSLLAKAILEQERNGGLSGSTKSSLKALAEDGKGPYA